MSTLHTLLSRATHAVRTVVRDAVFGTEDELGPPSPTAADLRRVEQVGLHQLLPYDQYDPHTELYYNTDSVGFCLNVAPQPARHRDVARTPGVL
ncbi:TraC family protein [Burkholderia glumae]|uniref:TraC family protein n=1 Tax=Burkholderia glumae TaxID=337 RepID=UPI0020367908|nr:TraC family protein [Burkholderia glumae]MCM2547551.1 conjugal transfer protein TraC [Burkholderia glumae]